MDERSNKIVAEPIGARGRLFESDHPDSKRRENQHGWFSLSFLIVLLL
jgi:hypothetical protein